jgi:hypothetical protein
MSFATFNWWVSGLLHDSPKRSDLWWRVRLAIETQEDDYMEFLRLLRSPDDAREPEVLS